MEFLSPSPGGGVQSPPLPREVGRNGGTNFARGPTIWPFPERLITSKLAWQCDITTGQFQNENISLSLLQ